jgi:Carbohydrate-selective porin, OprB family
VDTGKLGLWPGGFLKVSADSGFGHSVLGESGAIVPVNTAAIIPFPGDQTTALTNATFMQFLSTKFGVMVGKVYTLDGFQGEFAGNYRSQFMNLGLVIPTVMDLVPISAFGGGIVALPLENILLSGRPLDTFGIGWARSDYTSNFVPFLHQQLDLGLDHDDVVEMDYNAALTAWLSATLDLQIVNPALEKAVNASGTGLKNVDTAVVGGIRLYVRPREATRMIARDERQSRTIPARRQEERQMGTSDQRGIGKLRVLLVLLVLAALVAGYFWSALRWSYSSGERAGWVQKLSKKGWFCKTWEGEMAMVSMPGSMTEKFLFTVWDEGTVEQINKLMGRRVNLHYEQRVGLPTTCFGETRYYVTQVTLVEEIPLAPGVVVPTPAPPAPPATPPK